jgi:hypothetical protein
VIARQPCPRWAEIARADVKRARQVDNRLKNDGFHKISRGSLDELWLRSRNGNVRVVVDLPPWEIIPCFSMGYFFVVYSGDNHLDLLLEFNFS